MTDSTSIEARLQDVRARIAAAAANAQRDPADIRLVAVSKTFPAEFVRIAASAGQLDFGENKVQEGLAKIDELRDVPLRWHLIGHLQSNKANKAAAGFDMIHSVDTAGLLQKIDAAAAAAGRQPGILIQVDLAGEATKFGAEPSALPGIFTAARTMTAARVVGLMLIPPAVDEADQARPYFRQLRDIRSRLLDQGVDREMLRELSMGMSHDFEVAIEEGATMVRVGTAIFGGRT